MPLKTASPGGCCCTPPCSYSVCVHDRDCCGHPITGRVFTITGPDPSTSTVGTITTDGTGGGCLDVTATGPGDYTVTPAALSGHKGTAAVVTVACGANHVDLSDDVPACSGRSLADGLGNTIALSPGAHGTCRGCHVYSVSRAVILGTLDPTLFPGDRFTAYVTDDCCSVGDPYASYSVPVMFEWSACGLNVSFLVCRVSGQAQGFALKAGGCDELLTGPAIQTAGCPGVNIVTLGPLDLMSAGQCDPYLGQVTTRFAPTAAEVDNYFSGLGYAEAWFLAGIWPGSTTFTIT